MISWKSHALYLIDYQHWANDRLLEALDTLDDAMRTQEIAGKSATGLLREMVTLDRQWLERLQHGAHPEPVDLPPHEWRELKSAVRLTFRQIQHFLESKQSDWFEGEIGWRVGTQAEAHHWVTDVVTCLCETNTRLRGQVLLLLPHLGAPVVDINYLLYRREMKQSLENARRMG
ncbi:hypothetical protein KSF73_08130 [Burkholderiaceae bacterium DAT-1]|nr:hypothetical protein [Burkholderiaceae bacterium DAT-1]